jgi:membrane associated rhomboid family serine protease
MNTSDSDKDRIKRILYGTSVFILAIWMVKIIESIFGIELYEYGLLPKNRGGLLGIFTAPFLHADYNHLISNTTTLFAIVFILFYSYPRSAKTVFFITYFLTGLSVWLFARTGTYHIGASGLVYGLLSFLFFVGIFRKDAKAIAITLIITFMYGGFIWGVFPTDPKISFESHLAGLLLGLVCAVILRKKDPLEKKYDWEEEDEYDGEGENEDGLSPDNVKIYEDADEVYFDEEDIDEELERIKRKHNIK